MVAAVVAAGMLTLAGLADRRRDLEASGGSVVARPLLQGSARKVSALGSFYATGRKASTGYLVEVTRSCSASVIIAGFVAVAVLVALTGFRRLKPHLVLWGLLLAGVTALTVNMIRVALIALPPLGGGRRAHHA